MSSAIRRIVTVQLGGRIEINALELPVGTQAEVTVMEITPPSPKRTLSALLGLGRGASIRRKRLMPSCGKSATSGLKRDCFRQPCLCRCQRVDLCA